MRVAERAGEKYRLRGEVAFKRREAIKMTREDAGYIVAGVTSADKPLSKHLARFVRPSIERLEVVQKRLRPYVNTSAGDENLLDFLQVFHHKAEAILLAAPNDGATPIHTHDEAAVQVNGPSLTSVTSTPILPSLSLPVRRKRVSRNDPAK